VRRAFREEGRAGDAQALAERSGAVGRAWLRNRWSSCGASRPPAPSGWETRGARRAGAADRCRFSPNLSDVHGSDLHVLLPAHGSFLAQIGKKPAVCVHGVCKRCLVAPFLGAGC